MESKSEREDTGTYRDDFVALLQTETGYIDIAVETMLDRCDQLKRTEK